MGEELAAFVEKNEQEIDFDRSFYKISKTDFICLLCNLGDVFNFESDFVRHYKFQCPNMEISCLGFPEC